MELELQGKNLERENINEKKAKEMQEFINQLEEFVNNNNPLRKRQEESICVVKDRNDEKLTVVDISTGEEFDIFIAKSKEEKMKLNQANITNNLYKVSEEDFYHIYLGDNISLKYDYCKLYNEKIEITSKEAFAKLGELYFNLREEEGQIFTVDKITDEKIYLKGKDGGYFSLYQQAYPKLQEGDKLKKENRKYVYVN